MSYQNRRYRVVDGKLEKVWNGTNEPGWFKTKAEAWAAVAAPVGSTDEFPAAAPEAPTPVPVEAPQGTGYETWKANQLKSEIKARTGKGPRVGTESSKAAMIERLRALDSEATPEEPVAA